MADITDRGSLAAWLENRPPENAVLIATRSAMRVLPLIRREPNDVAAGRWQMLVLRLFRALAVADFVSRHPSADFTMIGRVWTADAAGQAAAAASHL